MHSVIVMESVLRILRRHPKFRRKHDAAIRLQTARAISRQRAALKAGDQDEVSIRCA